MSNNNKYLSTGKVVRNAQFIIFIINNNRARYKEMNIVAVLVKIFGAHLLDLS